MDAEIATIRERRYTTGFAGKGSIAGDFRELLDALETAQAESDFQHRRADAFCKAAMRREVENKNLEAERDAVQAENTRLAAEYEVACNYVNEYQPRALAAEAERDRLTNQITDLTAWIRSRFIDRDELVEESDGAFAYAAFRSCQKDAVALLARCSPNEETAEEKK